MGRDPGPPIHPWLGAFEERPAEVGSGTTGWSRGEVHLLGGVATDVTDPEAAGPLIDREPPRVPQSERPDLGARVGPAQEGVAGRDAVGATVGLRSGVEAQQLAANVGQVLGAPGDTVVRITVAHGEPQQSLGIDVDVAGMVDVRAARHANHLTPPKEVGLPADHGDFPHHEITVALHEAQVEQVPSGVEGQVEQAGFSPRRDQVGHVGDLRARTTRERYPHQRTPDAGHVHVRGGGPLHDARRAGQLYDRLESQLQTVKLRLCGTAVGGDRGGGRQLRHSDRWSGGRHVRDHRGGDRGLAGRDVRVGSRPDDDARTTGSAADDQSAARSEHAHLRSVDHARPGCTPPNGNDPTARGGGCSSRLPIWSRDRCVGPDAPNQRSIALPTTAHGASTIGTSACVQPHLPERRTRGAW